MHNPSQDIQEIIVLLESGLKYEGHDRHKMRKIDSVVYWLTNVLMISGVAAFLYFVILALI